MSYLENLGVLTGVAVNVFKLSESEQESLNRNGVGI